MTTDLATDHREVVRLFFEGDRSIDRLSLLSERCVWWNGLGRLPGAEGRTEFVGPRRDRRVPARPRRASSPLHRRGRRPLRPDDGTVRRRRHDRRRRLRVPPAHLHREDAGRARLRERLRLLVPLRRRRAHRPDLGALGHARRVGHAVPSARVARCGRGYPARRRSLRAQRSAAHQRRAARRRHARSASASTSPVPCRGTSSRSACGSRSRRRTAPTPSRGVGSSSTTRSSAPRSPTSTAGRWTTT